MVPSAGWRYAEGYRRHSPVGFSSEDREMLSEVLGSRLVRRGAPG
jgi:hypothetical protein